MYDVLGRDPKTYPLSRYEWRLFQYALQELLQAEYGADPKKQLGISTDD